MEKKEWSLEEGYNRAANYCSTAEKAENEVVEKLYQWGIDKTMHSSIIQRLREENFINDERYCNAYVHDKVAYQSWGRKKIYMMLQSKHLDNIAITQALSNIDTEVYFANLERLKRQRKGEDKNKILRFLLQRGYTYEEIGE